MFIALSWVTEYASEKDLRHEVITDLRSPELEKVLNFHRNPNINGGEPGCFRDFPAFE